ncbi:MAG: ABC transporter permease [Imperialibacter sp.]|uniref:ABC transporter permease n=1 Tax=Imperialibacter sp. TaxID=2038411 RepID=UPI003A83CCAE
MKTAPKILLWLLDRFCPPSRQDLKGDFLELYEYRAKEWGRGRASVSFFWDTLTVLPLWFLVKKKQPSRSSIPMFSHYVKIAFRNLSRCKAYSIINILGLAVGLGVCLLIYQYISFELSYDQFHSRSNRIYRLVETDLKNGVRQGRDISTVHELGKFGKENIPEIEEVVRINLWRYELGIFNPENDIPYQEDNVWFVDDSFLNVFDFPLLSGSRESALSEKRNIVLTEQMASKIFGEKDPIGKTLHISGGWPGGDYIVTGVLQKLPVNSHMQFDFLLPMKLLLSEEPSYKNNDGMGWRNFSTYVLLPETASPNVVSDKFDLIADQYFGKELAASNEKWTFDLQPLKEIHLYSDNLQDPSGNNEDIANIKLFSVIAVFVMLMAWANYINLSTSRSLHRAKEVGVRKAIGARKRQLIGQFLVESFLINGLAVILAFGIALLSLPVLNQMVGKTLAFTIMQSSGFWLQFVIVVVVGSLLSGLYPAFVLSSFKPVSMLKSSFRGFSQGLVVRKGIILFQFFLSILLISGTWLVYRQVKYMRDQDLGIDMEKILVVYGPRFQTFEFDAMLSNFSAFQQKVVQHHSVESISGTGSVPGKGNMWTGDVWRLGELLDDGKLVSIDQVDGYFTKTFDLNFLSGEPFREDLMKASYAGVAIVNEEAVKQLGLGSPQNALHQKVVVSAGDTLEVVGVVKNFHWHSLKEAQIPSIYMLNNAYGAYYSIRVSLSDMPQTIDYIKTAYDEVYPGNEFNYFFLDDAFNRQYQADLQFGNLFTAFSVLAIFISCLGLFALVSFSASLKTKEIGIRKVLGASVGQLMTLLSKEYLVLLLVASALAIPLVIWGGQQWLENYAFRVEMGVEFIVVPAFLLLVVSVLTVSHSTWKAARGNPVESLKTE